MRLARSLCTAAFVSAACLAPIVACSSSSDGASTTDGGNGASTSSGGSSASGGASSSGGTSSGGTSGAASGGLGGQTLSGLDAAVVSEFCGGGGCACSNGMDDDGDGQIDGFDTECTGPLDNDEGTFATGIPGDNKDPKWQDCFFDGNSGGGDDGCRYPTQCLTGEYEATDERCAQAQNCIDFCVDRTPNGCDCFGCCTIGYGPTAVNVRIEGTCSVEKLGDETACPRCTKSITCGNECGECELCPGKTVADLPASCTPKPPYDAGSPPGSGGSPPVVYPPNTCDLGRTPCASQSNCTSGEYCQQGCCVPVVR